MCLYSQLIKNRKYTKNKKNGGVVPTVSDIRTEYVPTKCGKCIECRKQYAREWQVRLYEDIKHNKNGKFITLTFSNESIKEIAEKFEIKRTNKETKKIETHRICDLQGYDRDNQIATAAVRHFLERWRKQFKTSVRHWLVTELGHKGTENIHLHGIIWTDESYDTIRKIWHYGYIWPRPETKIKTYVSEKTITYIVKYISKIDQRNKEYKAKVLASAKIGYDFIHTRTGQKIQYTGRDTKATYKTPSGHEIALPKYWKQHLFTEDELERMWIDRLDKQERWICGERIDISNGESDYLKTLQHYRKVNNTLGYGMRTNENRMEQEEMRRNILYETRIRNTKGTTKQ